MAGLVEADRGGRGRIRRCLRASVWSTREAFPCGAGSVGHRAYASAVGIAEHHNADGLAEQVTIPSCLNLHDDVITNTIAKQQDSVDAAAKTQQEEHNHAVGMGEHSNGVGMLEKVIVPSSLNLHDDYVITNTVAETVADTQQEEHNNVVRMAEQYLRTDNVTEIQLVESDHEDEMHRQHLSHSQSNPASLESDLQLKETLAYYGNKSAKKNEVYDKNQKQKETLDCYGNRLAKN
ncbi:hypothetical protein H0E87_023384 [Populus deltoides]|uniref:Uncharacterized protein n=1 Tax=Populus deltoides TaxID=3696 RepID=A0A8T2XCE6_POPDE|nr:hypothetical protein H0E87_023384 [Populus deltoides]